jgi:hypothetical protein
MHVSVKVAGSKIPDTSSNVPDGFVNPGLEEVKILDMLKLSPQGGQ